MGKRVKRFSEEDAKNINIKILNYIQYFEEGQAKDKNDDEMTKE